jgi:hypothetical protein
MDAIVCCWVCLHVHHYVLCALEEPPLVWFCMHSSFIVAVSRQPLCVLELGSNSSRTKTTAAGGPVQLARWQGLLDLQHMLSRLLH